MNLMSESMPEFTAGLRSRAEQPEDISAVRAVNMAAFGRSDEADLVDQLRGLPSTLSWVAVAAEQIVGHIFYSPVTIAGTCPGDRYFLGLAPVAIHPDFQRQGIGSALIQQSLQACARSGCQAVVVLGDPAFYSRFGFTPAKPQGLVCEFTAPEEAFMVLALSSGALDNCRGTVQYHSAFSQFE